MKILVNQVVDSDGSKLYVGASTGNNNASTTNGNTYLKLVEDNKVSSAIKIYGGGSTSVTSDASGNILISSNNSSSGSVSEHYTTTLKVGASGSVSNAATTNGNTYLKVLDNTTVQSNIKIAGSGGTTVTSDASGSITITSPVTSDFATKAQAGNKLVINGQTIMLNNVNDNLLSTISLPMASAGSLGLIKIGNNVSLDSGGILSVPVATTSKAGVVKVGTGLSVSSDGTLSVSSSGSSKADALTTARTIRVNLASTTAASFDGTANITPGVTGALPIANGGTGQTTAAAARNALGLGNTTGALPIANGGTGATSAAAARNALGLGNTTGALPIANGGTGATTKSWVDLTNDQNIGGTKTFTGYNLVCKPSGTDYSATIWACSPHATLSASAVKTESNAGGIAFCFTSANTSQCVGKVYGRRNADSSGSVVILPTVGTSGTTNITIALFKRFDTVANSPYGALNIVDFAGHLVPRSNGGYSLGLDGYRWKQLYATTATISTSDKNKKQQISDIDEELLDAWEDVNFSQFKFNDSVEKKGDENARIHMGAIAQDVMAVMDKHEVDVTKYSFFCKAEIKEGLVQEDRAFDEDEKEPPYYLRPASTEYGLRYEEFLVVEAAYLRRENKKLKERLALIEEKLRDLL